MAIQIETTPVSSLIQVRRVRVKLFALAWVTVLSFSFFFLPPMQVFGQAAAGIEKDVQSIQAIHRAFEQHVKQRALLVRERERIDATIRANQGDMEAIQNDVVQKQMQLAMLQWESRMLLSLAPDFTWGQVTGLPSTMRPRGNANPARDQMQFTERMRVQQNLQLSALDQTIASFQLAELDEATRRIVSRQIEAFRDGEKWQADLARWMETQPKFLDRYWRFTDMHRIYTRESAQRLLDAMRDRGEENYPAMIAQALLEERVGEFDDALESINHVIEHETPLHIVALAVRAVIHHAKDEARKSKSDLASAYRLDKQNPYYRLIRAKLSAAQSNWTDVEAEASAVLKVSELEWDARRLLVAAYAMRAQRAPRYSLKAMEHAKLVVGLSDEVDWHAQLLHAIALYSAGDRDEALAAADRAVVATQGENRELCDKVATSIRDELPFEWDFSRR